MDDPPAAAVRKPCCVCQHCTKCKSRHYCGKACQLVYWYEHRHKAQCKKLAAEYQARMLDALLEEKLDLKKTELEAPGTSGAVEDDVPADGSTGPRAPTIRAGKTEVNALNDGKPNWRRATCAICLDLLPLEGGASRRTFYPCCCKKICTPCADKCNEYDTRCFLCRAPPSDTDAEWLRRMQKNVDEENAEAQEQLGNAYYHGRMGLKKSPKRASQLYARAAAQGHPEAQARLGICFETGIGVKIDYKTAARWNRLQSRHDVNDGKGVAQSYEEAVKWYRLAAAQGHANALFNLGVCHEGGQGVPRDYHEALRLYKRAAAEGCADKAEIIDKLKAHLARCAPLAAGAN